MMLKVALIAAAAVLAAPVMAQEAVSAEATAAATAIVDLMSPPGQAKAQLDAQMKEVRSGNAIRAQLSQSPVFKQEAAKNKPAFNSAMARIGGMQADALGPIRNEMLTASRQAAIAAYARGFTVEELNAIAEFYKSPAGAKLIGTQGRINAEVGKAMQAKFQPRIVAAEKAVAPKIEAELKKLFPAPAAK